MKKNFIIFTMLVTLLLILVGCKNTPSIKKYDMSNVKFIDEIVEFDNQNHSLEITGALPQGVKVSYTDNTFKEVGSYSVTATFTGEEGYEAIPDMKATLTINKKELTLDKTSYSLKYNGDVQTINPVINGLLDNFPADFTINYSSEIKEVGNYTATVSLTNNTDIYSLKNNTIRITVAKEIYTVTFKSEGKNDIVYKVPYGENLENFDDPFAKEGYTTSWDQDETILQNIKENKTINVLLTPNNYKVTFNNNLSGDEELTEEYDITYDSYFENPSDIMENKTNIDGYIFKGWSTTRNGEVEFNLNEKFEITSNDTSANEITLYAIYDKKFIISESTITAINPEYKTTDILDIPSKNYTWTSDSVTSVEINKIFMKNTFKGQGCKSITTIIIPSTIKTAETEMGLQKTPFESLYEVTNVYFNAKNLTGTRNLFYYLSPDSICTFHVGKDVEEMNFSLYYSGFEKIDFTNASNLKVIGEHFFATTNFGSIYLPTSVTTIKKNALGDNQLSTKLIVYYAGTEEDFNKITIDPSNDGDYTVVYQNN